MNQFWF